MSHIASSPPDQAFDGVDRASIVANPALAEHARAIHELAKRTREDIIAIGRHLAEARKHVGHGAWLDWIGTEFGWSDQTARRFIQVYELSCDAKFNTLVELDLPLSVLYQLAAPKSEEVRQEITERLEAGEEITRGVVDEAIARRKVTDSADKTEPTDLAADDEDPSITERRAQMAALAAESELVEFGVRTPGCGECTGLDQLDHDRGDREDYAAGDDNGDVDSGAHEHDDERQKGGFNGREQSKPRKRKSRFDAEHYAFLLGEHIQNLAVLPEENPERFENVLAHLVGNANFISDLAELARRPKIGAIIAAVIARASRIAEFEGQQAEQSEPAFTPSEAGGSLDSAIAREWLEAERALEALTSHRPAQAAKVISPSKVSLIIEIADWITDLKTELVIRPAAERNSARASSRH
jgi:hypothetical protein